MAREGRIVSSAPHVARAGYRAFCSCGWEWLPDVVNTKDFTNGQLEDLTRNMAEGHFIHEHDRQGTIEPEAVYVRR